MTPEGKGTVVPTLHILSAGAARDLLHALLDDFRAETGAEAETTFGTAGAVRDKVASGDRFDVVILTRALMDSLASSGQVAPGSVAELGEVHSGIAVRQDMSPPPIANADQLRKAIVGADAIFCPDVVRSTSGAHFMNVIEKLGIREIVQPRLTETPNGAAAMKALASSTGQAIGSTQVSEILGAPGVTLVGPLPAPFALATRYSVGVGENAREPQLASSFASWLASSATLDDRRHAGFEATD
jgi:molybdate transport system substrate-binding protein